MRKLLLALVLVLNCAAFLVPATVGAVDVVNPVCKNAPANDLPAACKDNATGSTEDPLVGRDGLLTKGLQILVFILGIAAVFVIIIAGLRIVASNGDSNTIATMQKAIIFAVIGLAIAGVSQFLVTFLVSKL